MKKNVCISDTQSEKIATRLKILREEKKISHETLSRQIGISKDTLIKYEKSERHNSSFGANKGMRIDFAVALASFYDTSTDYILCNTDIKSPDLSISDICQKTGLNEVAVNNLIKIQKKNDIFGIDRNSDDFTQTINALLGKDSGIDILDSLTQYLYKWFTLKDGTLQCYNGFSRKLSTEELSDTELYLNIMPQIKAFQKQIIKDNKNDTE